MVRGHQSGLSLHQSILIPLDGVLFILNVSHAEIDPKQPKSQKQRNNIRDINRPKIGRKRL